MRKAPLLAGLAATSIAIAAPSIARADPSAWVAASGGVLVWKQKDQPFGANGTIAVDAGFGTTPDGPVIVGMLFRLQPVVKHGPDLSMMFRVATRGFQAGSFGAAFDAGMFGRLWGDTSFGFAGGASLGLPLGFTITAQAHVGINNAIGFGAVAGLDVLRLSVFRRVLTGTWPNPLPAYTPTPEQKRTSGLGLFF